MKKLLFVTVALLVSLLAACTDDEKPAISEISALQSEENISQSVSAEQTLSTEESEVSEKHEDSSAEQSEEQSEEDDVLLRSDENSEWKYNVYRSYIELTEYIGEPVEKLVVPAEIEGLPVKVFGASIISGKDGCMPYGIRFTIKYLELPDTLEIIGAQAFDECCHLEEIKFPKGLLRIESTAFCGCVALKELNLPEGLEYIGNGSFNYCKSLEKIVLPSTVKNIGKRAFGLCLGLKKVTLPEGITVISEGAFDRCNALEEINIPSTVIAIEEGAFYCCHLQNVVLPCSVTSVGSEAFVNGYEYDSWDTLYTFICAPGVTLTVLNPDMKFDDKIGNPFEVRGYAGSTAEVYCRENGLKFAEIE